MTTGHENGEGTTRFSTDGRARPLAWRAALLAAAAWALPPSAGAVVANWTGTDGDYGDAANWDTNPLVPLNGGTNYDVFIAGSGNTVTYDEPLAGAVNSLDLGAGVTLLTDSVSSSFSAGMTQANDATLIAEDRSTLSLGGGDLDRSTLIARNGFQGTGGATLTTTVTSYTGVTSEFNVDRRFEADGAGSLLDLSTLTTLERSGDSTTNDLRITATDGGRIDLTGIAGITDSSTGTNGRVHVTASGVGSEVDMANVTTLSDTNLEVRDGGEVTGQLTSLTGRSRLIKRSTGVIDLSALASADNAELIAEDGATLSLGGASVDAADLVARKGLQGTGGATLTTTVTSYTGVTSGFNVDRRFEADGAGSLLDLSTVTMLERSGDSTTNDLRITATDGGRIDLTGIAGITDSSTGTNGRVHVTANGIGSEVDMVNVTTLSDTNLEVRDGGEVTGQLTSLTGRSQLIRRSTGVLDLSALASADNAELIAEDGATLALGAASVDAADLVARKGFQGAGGAQLTTTVTSYTGVTSGFNVDRRFEADGAGSLLDLSTVTTLERSGDSTTNDLSITATDGGRIDLTGIAGITDSSTGTNGRVHVTASGVGSEVDLVNVTTLSDTNLEVRDGGEITGQLTSLTGRSQLIKRSTGVLDMGALASADNAELIAEDGATLALGAASVDAADLVARKGFQGTGGAQLTTTATSYTGVTSGFNVDRRFEADGAGSLLDLSTVTTLERSGDSTTNDLRITATDGGRIDLTGIAGITDSSTGTNGRVHVTARGVGSEVDMANVTALTGADVTVEDMSTVDLTKLGAFSGGTLELAVTDPGAPDFHVADSLVLGEDGIVDVASSSMAVVVGPGQPAGADDGTLTVAAGGTLTGTGTVIGTLVNAGIVGPGASPGTLSVDGDFEQDLAAILAIEIGGLAAGSAFDLLDVTGSASLAGTVSVSLFDGYVPGAGDTFEFLTASGGVLGLFDAVSCTNCLGTGIDFELSHGTNAVTLNAVAAPVPLPGAVWLLAPGLALLSRARRRV